MSVRINKPFLFQSLKGKSIKFTKSEQKIINSLNPLIGGEWDGAIKEGCTVKRKDRDEVKTKIKNKLIKIQGNFCIYCGLHEDHCGRLEREHIAAKGTASYPTFMFEPLNLALACHHCNVDLKGEINTITRPSKNYNKCKFNIVHPYLDFYDKHILFVVENSKALIKSAPRSKKGRATIKLFELDSVPKTNKRSGLLLISSLKFNDKYDIQLEAVLKSKFVRL
jgi:hypothetical protein